jgi:hypothetical protein
VGDRDHARAIRQRRLEGVDVEAAVVANVDPVQHSPLPLTQEVPGHDVGVVLHDTEHDLVALADPRPGEGGSDEVDRLGRRAREDDLLEPPGVQEAPDALPGALEGLGGAVGERMEAPMHIGVFVPVRVVHAVEHRVRLLRRGAGVEIDQPVPVDLFREDREVGSDLGEIEGHSFSSHPSITPASASLSSASSRGSSSSARKARVSMVSASAFGTPRLMR